MEQGTNDSASSSESDLQREVRFAASENFLPILEHLQITLIVSTYQAGKVAVVRSKNESISLSLHNFSQPMGIAHRNDWLAVGAAREIWFLKNEGSVARSRGVDAQFVARKCYVTGNVQAHELAWVGGELWFVNTLFSCLCTLDDQFSFVPRWKPAFISDIAPEDRCHLNGLAVKGGAPRYATAHSETDHPQGWRTQKDTSGCLIDIPSGTTVARGFAMPHSPRVDDSGNVWLLDSGRGQLLRIDPDNGSCATIEQLPGYARGMALAGQFAFVGLSKVRETAVFGGVPVADQPDKNRCAVAVIDLLGGCSVAFLEFDSGVDELFDIQILPNAANITGPHAPDDGDEEVWVAPPPQQDNADLTDPNREFQTEQDHNL